MAIAGLRGTGDWATDERPKNFRELILWRDPNGQAPLTALMSKMRKETTDDPEFSWYEEELRPIRVNVSVAALAADTALTLDTTEAFAALDLVAGDLLLVETNSTTAYSFELLEVASTPTAAGSLTVTRGAAGTTAADIAAGTYLLKVGNAFEEGAASPDSSTRNPTKQFNYCQIFKTTYNLTETARHTRTRTGDPLKNDKKRKMFDHSVAMEQAFIFGNRYETVGANGKPKRYTGGLYQFLADNYDATTSPTIVIWTDPVTTDEDAILDGIYDIFDFGHSEAGNERLGLCGNVFLNRLNQIAKNSSSTRIQYDGQVDIYGMKLQRWVFPQGTIYLRTHPLLNMNSRFTKGCFLINPASIRYRPLTGRDVMFKDNIQNNDEDAMKGQWIGEVGVEWHHLKTMKYLEMQW